MSPEQDLVSEVAAGIFLVRVPLPFALKIINCYVIREGGRWALVDCGYPTEEGVQAVRAGLRALGGSPRDLEAIFVTHHHPDHIGLAGLLQEESGAPVLLHALTRRIAETVMVTPDERWHRAYATMLRQHGVPEVEATWSVDEFINRRRIIRPLLEARAVQDGEVVELAGFTFRAIWTPGHADGHLCLLRESDGVLLSGDHLLPKITPNVSLFPEFRPDPLRDFLASLQKIAALPVTLGLPSHGRPFPQVHERIAALQRHHDARLARILEALNGQACTASEVSRRVFGELDSMDNRRFAVGEVLSHLEYLRAEGRVVRESSQGVYRYRAVAGGA